MDSAMEVDGRLAAFAAFAPKVDAEEVSALVWGTRWEKLRVVIKGGLQIVEELDMVCIRMVWLEPRLAGDLSCLNS